MSGEKEIGERLAIARKAAGYESAAAAARALGMSYPTYAGHENGSRGLRGNIERYARKYGVSVDWLLTAQGLGPSGDAKHTGTVAGPVALRPGKVQFGGYVGAGGFLPADDVLDQDLEHFEVPSSVVPNPEYPELPQFAWLVRGDSMSEAGIHEGHWVVAARHIDYVEKIGELYNGLVVIVQRTRFGGSEIERTIKEVEFSATGTYLIPRSSNPAHRTLFIPHNHEADSDEEETSILAVVLSAFKVFSRRGR